MVVALAVISGCKEEPRTGGGAGTDATPRVEDGPAAQLRIEPRPARVGAISTSETTSITELELVGSGRNEASHTTLREVRHIEVVEADGPVIRKAKVHYEQKTRAEREGTVEQEVSELLDGRKFMVWLADGKLAAITDAGAAVPAAELTELLGDLDDEIGVVPGIDRVLFGRTWPVGIPVTLGPDDLAALGSDMPQGTRATAGTISVVRRRDGVATFQVDLSIAIGQIGSNGFTVTSTATIEASVAGARRLSRHATGTVEGVLDGMQGRGTLTEHEEMVYR